MRNSRPTSNNSREIFFIQVDTFVVFGDIVYVGCG